MHRKTHLILLLALLLLLSGCTARPSEADTALPQLIIGSDNYRPYNYLDEDGAPAGIDVELATEACRRMGYEPVFLQINWDEKDQYLADGRVDCLWGCFSINGRESDYLWTRPYMTSRQVVAVRSDSDIYTLSDLEGRTVAVQMSSKPEDIFAGRTDVQVPQVRTLYCLLNMDEVAAALHKQYVEACASHAAALANALDRSGVDYRFLEEDLLRSQLGVAFSPDADPALRDRLDRTLADMLSDGTTRRILESYGLDADKALGGLAS